MAKTDSPQTQVRSSTDAAGAAGSATAAAGTAAAAALVPAPGSPEDVKRVLTQRLHSIRRRIFIAGLIGIAFCLFFLLFDALDYWHLIGYLRTKRLIGMIVVAASLSTATVIFQTITQNRILSPSVMGFDSMFALIATASVFIFTSEVVNAVPAIIMFFIRTALMVAMAVLLFTSVIGKRRNSVMMLVLVGIVFGTLLRSITSFLSIIMDPNEFLTVQNTNTAGFQFINEESLKVTIGVFVLMLVLSIFKARTWDILALGKDMATNLGVNYTREVKFALAVSSILIACSTALVGPLLFFGLLVVNIAIFAMGTSKNLYLIPGAVFIGVAVLIGGQAVLEFLLDMGTVLPVVIEFVGGSLLLAMIVKESRS